MRDYGTLISTKAQFPNARVYRRDAADGPVFTIAFRNLERTSGLLLFTVTITAFTTPFAVMAVSPALGTLLLLLIAGTTFLVVGAPGPIRQYCRRTIEIRPDRDELRFFRGRRLKGRYALSALTYLTVEPHPDAQWARMERQARGVSGPADLDYVHCLYGWFGVGGASQVELMHRVQWPPRLSLREIREAIEWTRKQAAAGPARTQRAESADKKPRSRRGQGAPLD